MAENTVFLKIDTAEKELWDKINTIAGALSSDDLATLSTLIENADDLLALLDDGSDEQTET